jgi:plastocyanin
MARTLLRNRLIAVLAGGLVATALSACENDNVPKDADLIAGKKAFAERCGACHVLRRANTKGTQGPDLDAAFRQSLADGLGRDTIHGVVLDQILYPAIVPKSSPAYMPPKLVTGKLASDVSAYVAAVAARPGEDEGKLATAVPVAGAGKPIAAKDGKLEIPADPTGQLAYVSTKATAPPGKLVIESKNDASIPHDIAIKEKGINADGDDVQDGGVSRITVDVKPGTYTYFCTVPGHLEGGMKGTLTVE